MIDEEKRPGDGRVARFLMMCLAWVMGLSAPAQNPVSNPSRVERVAALGRLWGTAKYFHPYLAYRQDLDWDAALVEAIPKVEAASTPAEYSSAVQGMLSRLGDPATLVLPAHEEIAAPSVENNRPLFTTTREGVLLVDLGWVGSSSDTGAIAEELASLPAKAEKSKGIVFDLRARRPVGDYDRGMVSYALDSSGVAEALIDSPVAAPAQRSRFCRGFPPQAGSTSGGYYSAFLVQDAKVIRPMKGAKASPVVFLVDADSDLPPEALALQAAGKGGLVADGGISDAGAVETRRISLTDGLTAQLRLGELLYPDGTVGVQPDILVERDSSISSEEKALAAAVALVQNLKPIERSRRQVPAVGTPPPERGYAEMGLPAREYRMMAAFRIWAAISFFYPYRDLMGGDWDASLVEALPKVAAAKDPIEYGLALSEMTTRIHDSHVGISGGAISKSFGAPSPLSVQVVEGQPVVTGFLDDEAAKAAGARVGDVVVTVNGADSKECMAFWAKYTAASTPQALDFQCANKMLRAGEGEEITLQVRGSDEKLRTLKMPCKRAYWGSDLQGSGEVVQVLPGNVGYADLRRLMPDEVGAMFEKLKGTRAIIFDMRGYPNGTAWDIAPRIAKKEQMEVARFDCAIAMGPGGSYGEAGREWAVASFTQRLPLRAGEPYTGKTIMLIDERAISQAEHSGLFFEAASGTKFVGSPTTGANGDITMMLLPGGLTMTFTGQSVRHADGHQLQRVGLQPEVEVRPTIRGIREGRDEVLEKAIEFLKK